MRRFWGERGDCFRAAGFWTEQLLSQHGRQAQRPKAHPGALEELSAGNEKVLQLRQMLPDVLVVGAHSCINTIADAECQRQVSHLWQFNAKKWIEPNT